jgi:hypothetical protein
MYCEIIILNKNITKLKGFLINKCFSGLDRVHNAWHELLGWPSHQFGPIYSGGPYDCSPFCDSQSGSSWPAPVGPLSGVIKT